MKKVKKLGLTILITILTLFLISSAVELIDNKINGEMYSKIDTFIHSLYMINNSPEMAYFANQAILHPSQNRKKNLRAEKDYQYVIKKMQGIEIPNNLPEKRKKLLVEIKKDFMSMAQDSYKQLKIQEDVKINKDEKAHLVTVYGCNILKTGYYLTPKVSDAKVRNNIKSRYKNSIGKVYITLTKVQFEKSCRNLTGKEN